MYFFLFIYLIEQSEDKNNLWPTRQYERSNFRQLNVIFQITKQLIFQKNNLVPKNSIDNKI